jgi:hypothetical protein
MRSRPLDLPALRRTFRSLTEGFTGASKERFERLVAEDAERERALQDLRNRPRAPLHPLFVFIRERGLSLSAAANILGQDVRTLRNIISWKHEPHRKRKEAIAAGLGVKNWGDLFLFGRACKRAGIPIEEAQRALELRTENSDES